MLSKVTNDTYDIQVSTNTTPSSGELANASWFDQTKRDEYSYTAPVSSTYNYSLEFTRYINTNSWQTTWQTEIYKNQTRQEIIQTQPPFSGTINLSVWDIFGIRYAGISSSLIFKYTRSKVTLTLALNKISSYLKCLPRELKTIGNKASATIFWIHIDGSRVTQE